MKFIKLESRGGNYLVVAENVAWLRTAENGQTSVGIIGSQPLLVVGSIEEVAEKILTATAHETAPAPAAPPAPVAPPPVVAAPAAAPPAEPVAQAPEPVTPEPEPVTLEPEPVEILPEPEAEPVPEPVAVALAPRPAPPPPAPEPAAQARSATPAPARPRPVARNSASLWERPAAAPAKGLKVKAGSQRMMGALE